jgi:hypothetical protein
MQKQMVSRLLRVSEGEIQTSDARESSNACIGGIRMKYKMKFLWRPISFHPRSRAIPNRFCMFAIPRTVFVDVNAVSDLSGRMANRKNNAVGLRGTIMTYREN